jgi:hypothetical protein
MFEATGTTLLTHVIKCKQPPWFDPTMNVTIKRRPSDYQIRKRWQPFCLKLSQYQPRGPCRLQLRLRRESYCSCNNSGGKSFFHWYAGSYWECLQPTPSTDTCVRLTLTRPTTWTPSLTDTHVVPLQAHAHVRNSVYTHANFDDRVCISSESQLVVQSFSEHIMKLLSNVQWISSIDHVLTILQSMSRAVPLLVVSDGSSLENQHMSFGVAIGLVTGEVLVELS